MKLDAICCTLWAWCPSILAMQKGSEVLGYEAEALAIYDLMRFVKPPISTLCVGNAFGEAAMLLAAGSKVYSFMHPTPPHPTPTHLRIPAQRLFSSHFLSERPLPWQSSSSYVRKLWMPKGFPKNKFLSVKSMILVLWSVTAADSDIQSTHDRSNPWGPKNRCLYRASLISFISTSCL